MRLYVAISMRVCVCVRVCVRAHTYTNVTYGCIKKKMYLNTYDHIWMYIYIHIYTDDCIYIHTYYSIRMIMMMIILLIPDTCCIQPVYASACACMLTLSTASSDAPSSTSTRTVAACPRQLAHINAVLPLPFSPCEYSQVITVQRSIGWDEREHAHEYIYTCQYMHMYTHTQTSPMCVDTFKKKKGYKYVWTYMHVYIWGYM